MARLAGRARPSLAIASLAFLVALSRARNWRRGHRLAQSRKAALFGAIAAAALLSVLALAYRPGPTGADAPARAVGGEAPQAPLNAASLPKVGATALPAPAGKLQDAPVARPPQEPRLKPYRIAGPYEIADGLTFGPEGALRTRLAGLEGPSRDAVCNDREGRPWACGLQARAALHNATRGQSLLCSPLGEPAGGLVPAHCRGEADVGRELVRAGFARPTAPDADLDAAAAEAQRHERGLWNGGWTIRTAIR